MINIHELIEAFRALDFENKKKKVINLLQAIYDKVGEFGDTLDLLKKVENVPEKLLVELYTSVIQYGDDMNNIKIKEKMGETSYKLQIIREAEAKEKVREEQELVHMEHMIASIDDDRPYRQ